MLREMMGWPIEYFMRQNINKAMVHCLCLTLLSFEELSFFLLFDLLLSLSDFDLDFDLDVLELLLFFVFLLDLESSSSLLSDSFFLFFDLSSVDEELLFFFLLLLDWEDDFFLFALFDDELLDDPLLSFLSLLLDDFFLSLLLDDFFLSLLLDDLLLDDSFLKRLFLRLLSDRPPKIRSMVALAVLLVSVVSRTPTSFRRRSAVPPLPTFATPSWWLAMNISCA